MPQKNYACNIYLYSFHQLIQRTFQPTFCAALCVRLVLLWCQATRIMMVGGAGALQPFAFSASHAAAAPCIGDRFLYR